MHATAFTFLARLVSGWPQLVDAAPRCLAKATASSGDLSDKFSVKDGGSIGPITYSRMVDHVAVLCDARSVCYPSADFDLATPCTIDSIQAVHGTAMVTLR